MIDMIDKLQKLSEYSLYMLAFFLSLQTRLILRAGSLNGGYSEYSTISLFGTDIVLGLIVIFYLFASLKKFKIQNPKSETNSKSIYLIFKTITNPLFLLLLVLFFSNLFVAIDKLLALYRAGVLALGFGLFYVLRNAKYDFKKLIWFFLAGLALQAMLGIWQFTTQSSFQDKRLGIAEHRASDLGVSVVESGDGRFLRAYGGLDHPNIFGGVMAVGLILAVWMYLETIKNIILSFSEELGNSVKKIQSPGLRSRILLALFFDLTLIVLIILFTSALIVSFSRSAWLAAIAGIILVYFFYFRKNILKIYRLNIIKTLVIVLSVCAVFIYSYSGLFFTRLSGVSRLEVKSTEERIASAGEAWSLIKKHPFFGVGLGNYTIATAQELTPGQPSYYYQPVHNAPLLVLAEAGMFGAGLVIVLIWLFIRYWKLDIRNYKHKQDYYIINSFRISLILLLLILSVFDHWLFSLHFGILLVFLILGARIEKFPQYML
jgi:O-antigen ligase